MTAGCIEGLMTTASTRITSGSESRKYETVSRSQFIMDASSAVSVYVNADNGQLAGLAERVL